MACVVVPPYINEIASQRVRGAAGAAFQLALTIGILVAQVVGLPFIAGSCQGWGWGLSIVFLLPLAGLVPLFLLPNSPPQMLVKYNDEEQATADLQKLRGIRNVQADLETIRSESREQTGGTTESLSIPQVITGTKRLSIDQTKNMRPLSGSQICSLPLAHVDHCRPSTIPSIIRYQCRVLLFIENV